jgi:hypothetical protein
MMLIISATKFSQRVNAREFVAMDSRNCVISKLSPIVMKYFMCIYEYIKDYDVKVPHRYGSATISMFRDNKEKSVAIILTFSWQDKSIYK